MIDQAALDEVFPNNPITEVAFEIRFPTNLRIIPRIYEVQEWLGLDYSKINREEITGPGTPTVITYQFSNPKLEKSVKIWEERFAVIYSKYDSFESFKAECLERSVAFFYMFRIERLMRVGLRYVNNISIPSEDGIYQIARCVRPYTDLSRLKNVSLNQFGLQISTRKDERNLLIRNLFAPQDPSQAVYILDTDAFFENAVKVNELGSILDDLHHDTQVEFLSHVTEDYKQKMRRENESAR